MASPVTWLGQKNMVGVTGGSEVSGAGMHQTCRSWKKLLFFFFLTHYCRKYRQTGIISTLDLLIHNRFFRIMWWYPHVHNSACFSGSADWLYKTRGRCQWTLWVLCYIKKENLQRVPGGGRRNSDSLPLRIWGHVVMGRELAGASGAWLQRPQRRAAGQRWLCGGSGPPMSVQMKHRTLNFSRYLNLGCYLVK